MTTPNTGTEIPAATETPLSTDTPALIDAPQSNVTDLQPDSTDAMIANKSRDMMAQHTNSLSQSEDTLHSQCNVGRTEQKFRIGAGAALVSAAAFAPVSLGWRIGLGVLGAAELITGAMRYCPVSRALGINTCRAGEQ